VWAACDALDTATVGDCKRDHGRCGQFVTPFSTQTLLAELETHSRKDCSHVRFEVFMAVTLCHLLGCDAVWLLLEPTFPDGILQSVLVDVCSVWVSTLLPFQSNDASLSTRRDKTERNAAFVDSFLHK
jgi:hypothetical protein